MVLLRERARRTVGFVEPCRPSSAKRPPLGPGWIHQIKRDGFRLLARRNAAGVRLITRNGNDLTGRFPFIAVALTAPPARPCLIDGEIIICGESRLATFAMIRAHKALATAVHCVFDLLELDAEDLRRQQIEQRKRRLADLLRDAHPTLIVNEHYEDDGAITFKHARKLGCEAVVSKRLGSPDRSGRSAHRVKLKNPMAPAARRKADEDWS